VAGKKETLVKKTARFFCAALLAALAVGCATAASSVQTNKDAENLRPMKTAYVAVTMNDTQTMFRKIGTGDVGAFLAERFEQGLTGKSVAAKGVRLDGLELGSDVKQQALDFGAETMIAVDMAGGVIATGNVLNGGTLVVSVTDIPSGRTIWKGKMTLHGRGWGVTETMLSDFVDRVLESMTADGLL
jgi:hypothetical protein